MGTKLTTKKFVERAKLLHGKKYDYSKVEYKGIYEDVLIICKKHGAFTISAHKHINSKRGCQKCGRERMARSQSLTTSEFIAKAREIHGNKYDYSKVEYINAKTPIKIICPIQDHGAFPQNPSDHLYQESGCPKCGGRLISNTNEFIQASIKLHGEKYDYSKTVFVSAKEKVIIGCPFHGDFSQSAYNHSHGYGCSKCGDEIRSFGDTINDLEKIGRDYDGSLYFLEIYNESEHFYKIGVSRNLKRRYTGMLSLPYEWDILLEINLGMIKSYKEEQRIIEDYQQFKYTPKLYFEGITECFSTNILEHDETLRTYYEDYLIDIDNEN